MKILSVNVSMPLTVSIGSRVVATGIFKRPVAGRVWLAKLNLVGDGQADLEVHGGEFKAVYTYPFEHYAYWSRALGRDDLIPGAFGENFTVEGLLEDEVCIGDVFRFGDAVVEVTQPRLPCFKLAHKLSRPTLPKQFLTSGRSGFYHRVVTEGEVGAGDAIERLHRDPQGVSVRALLGLVQLDSRDADVARRALAVAALTPSWREDVVELVRQLEAEPPLQNSAF